MKPISDEAKRRVREALLRMVQEELDVHTQIRGSERAKPSIVGPWSMLTSDGGVWDVEAHTSLELYRQIRGHLSDTSVKELLLAVAGVKVSRLSVSDAELHFLHCLADQHGFFLLASQERYLPVPDVGKGNYCNAFELVGSDDERFTQCLYRLGQKSGRSGQVAGRSGRRPALRSSTRHPALLPQCVRRIPTYRQCQAI